MTDPLLPQEEGSTLLTEEEREGLKLSYVENLVKTGGLKAEPPAHVASRR